MTQKWNLQDIRPVGKGETSQKRNRPQQQQPSNDIEPVERKPEPPSEPEAFESIPVTDGKKHKKKRITIAIVIVVIILVVAYVLSTLMRGAEIEVHPKQHDTTVQATFSASRSPAAGELGYELLTLETEGERQVTATGKEDVSEKAVGSILIYNAHSKTPQRLIKNTRFESPDGLIYRIEESVEVPGMTVDSGGEAVPGVITAEVFSDGTGEQYNIPPSQFTIPGLKDTPQFEKMYAESTESFAKGFEGSKFIIDEKELETARQSLHVDLRNDLLEQLESKRPAGFVLYDNAVTFAFDSLPSTSHGDNLATIKERARLQVPLFQEDEFASFIAENTIAGYEGNPVQIFDPHTLTFSYATSTLSLGDISALSSLPFTLNGSVKVVWTFDEEALKNELLGLPKTAEEQVFKSFPAIELIIAVVRPFWKQSYPEDASEIEITTIINDE